MLVRLQLCLVLQTVVARKCCCSRTVAPCLLSSTVSIISRFSNLKISEFGLKSLRCWVRLLCFFQSHGAIGWRVAWRHTSSGVDVRRGVATVAGRADVIHAPSRSHESDARWTSLEPRLEKEAAQFRGGSERQWRDTSAAQQVVIGRRCSYINDIILWLLCCNSRF